MISNPKFGWCNFNIDNFSGHPSYLTDVPVDLINFFLKAKKEKSKCFFDEEGTEFTLVYNKEKIYIIASRERGKERYNFPKQNLNNLAKELYEDITNNLEEWASNFVITDEKEEIEQHKKEIKELLEKLKEEYNL